MINPAVTAMKNMRLGGFQNQRRKSTDITFIPFPGVLTAPRLAVKPGITGLNNPLRRFTHTPYIRGAVIIFKETFNGCGAGNLADIAAADAIGQSNSDTFALFLQIIGKAGAVKILINGFASGAGILAKTDIKRRSHWVAMGNLQ